ncbi:family 2 encapsulin nanocompartment cargo protein terpene cyclase [Nocardia sp. NPDC050406]|uniref:family 2 encapsulin nanocompartment cargo protein terpene cyclase n=1 Tax=Nocardia sp. NPDC050406 TaxID=3364318 RepID=UPI0037BA2FC2
MSVLSRAASPPATDEVAAAVAALLTDLTAAPPATLDLSGGSGGAQLPSATGPSESPEDTSARSHSGSTPVRLPGPAGLGTASILRGAAIAPATAAAAVRRPIPSGPTGIGATSATARLLPSAPPPAPQALVDAAVSATDTVAPAAVAPSGDIEPSTVSALCRIPLRPTGLGTTSCSPPHLARLTEPTAPPEEAAATTPIPHGPTGIGTASVQRKAKGQPIPTLYCPPPVRDNPVLAAAVNEGIIQWAEDIGLYENRLDELHKADFGRLIMLAHPDCDDADRLLAAAKCAVSEWSVDDYYCEEDADNHAPDGTPSSAEAELGPKLELAMAAMDPVFLPVRYQARLEEALQADPILRAFRTSFEHLSHYASPAQVARLRTEIAGWFIALTAEAGWRAAGRMPPVWEYLTNRQPHSFLPCMAPLDAIGGYELSAAEYTDARVRKVTTTAALASQMVNDLYSMAREDLSNGREFNLPTVYAAEEKCSRREAVEYTAVVHDELVHRFEAEATILAATGSPELRRFLGGLWAWMGGNRAWHADSRRYNERD